MIENKMKTQRQAVKLLNLLPHPRDKHSTMELAFEELAFQPVRVCCGILFFLIKISACLGGGLIFYDVSFFSFKFASSAGPSWFLEEIHLDLAESAI